MRIYFVSGGRCFSRFELRVLHPVDRRAGTCNAFLCASAETWSHDVFVSKHCENKHESTAAELRLTNPSEDTLQRHCFFGV